MLATEMEAKHSEDITDKSREIQKWKDKYTMLEEKSKKDKKLSADKIGNIKEDLEKTRLRGKEDTKRRKEELRKKDELIDKYKKQIGSNPAPDKDW